MGKVSQGDIPASLVKRGDNGVSLEPHFCSPFLLIRTRMLPLGRYGVRARLLIERHFGVNCEYAVGRLSRCEIPMAIGDRTQSAISPVILVVKWRTTAQAVPISQATKLRRPGAVAE